MNINYLMNLVIKEAKKAYKSDEIPVGSLIIENKTNLVISSAHNEVIKRNNAIKHAEILAIEKACRKRKSKYLSDTSIFITLEPCAMCAAAISEVKIENIYFGAYDEKKGSLESIMKIYNNKNYFVPQIYGGINEIKCSQILKNFFKNKRQKIA